MNGGVSYFRLHPSYFEIRFAPNQTTQLDNLQVDPFAIARGGNTDECAYRISDAAALANHAPHIVGGNVQFERDGICAFHHLNLDLAGVVHQILGDVFHEVLQIHLNSG